MSKEITTTVYESSGKYRSKEGKEVGYSKYMTTIPASIVSFAGIEKGDKLKWSMKEGKLVIEVRRHDNE
ncbi:MAG: AbrB/MazE/SpoVT family DNA-binding domain-containing protein [Promethearchaeota archaeon]